MAKTILILFVLAGMLIAPEDVSSCGPFLPEIWFASPRGPLDEARYFGGSLDIIQPHYARIYLMAAYRYLAGLGLSQADQQTLMGKPPGPDPWHYDDQVVQEWLRARVMVGAPALNRLDRFKMDSQGAYILNCGDDAFHNATTTLSAHFQAGLNHDDLRAWVAAQDDVFSNCGPGRPPVTPPALPAGAPHWMQADRAYQIAAAAFYGGEFDAAAADFRRIAADRSSPWHGIAPYLAARALIRKTTLVDPVAGPAAREQLHAVMNDPDAAPWRDSARGLLRYLDINSDPRKAIEEAAGEVETAKSGVAGSMNDYRLLLDRFESQGKEAPRDLDISDWIATMQHETGNHALEKWRATRSLPWLVAALTWADKPDAEMMAAAARVPGSAPAYLTVEFHRLRLLPSDEARPLLDAMLRRKLTVSARNLFLAERMLLARDWDELLRYAPRTAAAVFDSVTADPPSGQPIRYFDEDAARILDRQAPLAVLRHAAASPSLPANLRFAAARAVWVRSIMLHDTAMARDVAPLLASLAPYMKTDVDAYLAATDEKSRAFRAARLLLNNPGMRPSIDAGEGRETPTPKMDQFRDNWWCPVDAGRDHINAPLELLYQGADPDAAFRSAAARSAVDQQIAKMDKFPAASTFITRGVVEWAESNPNDPRVPEELQKAVRGVRSSCGGDAETDQWAQRAFELLHRRYGQTDAARRTPYWYKAGAH